MYFDLDIYILNDSHYNLILVLWGDSLAKMGCYNKLQEVIIIAYLYL